MNAERSERGAASDPRSAVAAAFCALAIIAGASAAHGLEAVEQERMQRAASYLFLNGLGLLLLARDCGRFLIRVGWLLICAGTLIFSGSLAGSALAGWSSVAAPLGGSLMILGWLLTAAAFVRRR